MEREPHKHEKFIKAWADGFIVEQRLRNGGWEALTHDFAIWAVDKEYRLQPTPPSVDWGCVAGEYNWLAVDANGAGHIYTVMPYPEHIYGDWLLCHPHPRAIKADGFKSFQSGSGGWRYLISCRPDPTGKREKQLKEYLDSLEDQEC